MGQKFNSDIFGTRQTPLSLSTPTQDVTTYQITGTTQIPVDMPWRVADVTILQSTGTTVDYRKKYDRAG